MGYLPQIATAKSSLRIEFIGTLLFVLVGTSALTAINIAGQATTATAVLVGTLAFAVAIGWLTYTFYRFPLPQFNPAVTLLFWIQGLLPLPRSLLIIATQLLGAVTASVIVALLYGSAGVEVRLGAPYPATLMGTWAAVAAEFLGSVIVLFAIQSAMNRQRLAFFNPFLLVGLGYGLGYLLATGVSGGALNPARALAPQLAAADLTGWWAYWIGPIAAALVIGLVTRNTSQSTHKDESTTEDNQPEPKQAQSQTKSKPVSAPAENATQQNESDVDQSQQQSDLQSKAQAAIAQLKDTTNRPKLPFSQLKPSFYPLDNSKAEQPTTTEGTTSDQPAAEAKSQKPSNPSTPAVKFVEFEPTESSDEIE